MQNVPKIVRERLRAATPSAHHPDADILTAYAERSLPDAERTLVLEHLARCSDCRDVIALALPANEETQKVFVPARRWLAWPALRWGFVTVGIIAIGGIGFLQIQKRHDLEVAKQTARLDSYSVALQNQPAPSATVEYDKEKSSAPAPMSRQTPERPEPSVGENELIAGAPTAPRPLPTPRSSPPAVAVPTGSGVGGGIGSGTHTQFPHGPLPPAQWQQQSMPTAPSAVAKQQVGGQAVSPPTAYETVEVVAAPLQMQAETTNQDVQLQAKAAQPPAAGYPLGGPVAKSKPPVTAVGANAAPQTADVNAQAAAPQALNGRNFTQLTTLTPAQTPRWNISPAGTLQRSFDQGQTWQDVEVNANAGFGQNSDYATSPILPYPPAKEARAKKKDLKSAPIYILRAVAANGPEVWVGYSQGLLLHSVDVGAHWAYVWPMAGGVNLSGDVVALDFADAQHGRVSTSTGEVWITSDDGQTWQKQ